MPSTNYPRSDLRAAAHSLVTVASSVTLLALVVGVLLTAPVAAAVVLGFVAAFALPVVLSVLVGRVVTSLVAGLDSSGVPVTGGRGHPGRARNETTKS